MRHAGSAADDWPQREVIPGGNGLLQAHASVPAATAPREAPALPGASSRVSTPLPAPAPGPAPAPAPASAPKPASPPERRRSRLYVIDALRLGAALLVALHHYAGTFRVDRPDNTIWGRPVSDIMPGVFRIAAYGWIGVEIFFVISGFVICMSCWDRRPRDFFVSRVIRLYPAYWFGVVFTTVVLTAYPVVWGRPNTREAFFNLSMLQSGSHVRNVDGVYWTLWSELRFYLVFLAVVATGLTYRKVVIFCCTWGALAAIAPVAGLPALSLLADPDSTWYFIAGLALYLMHRFGQDLLLWGILGLSWLMAQNELARRIEHVEHVSGWRGALLIYTLFLAFMAAVALGFTDRVQWKWLVTAGSLTYPFYLLHYAAGTTAIHYLHDRVDARLLIAGLIAASLLLSYFVHRFFERPVSRFLKRGLTKAFDQLGAPSR
ncbi:acyltransferase family protein [Streptomyces sp.]|uniref:acyltransferase family protein n=1 Tax=Streptomyces sp. TaxID=1931 RepID=UPI002F410255